MGTNREVIGMESRLKRRALRGELLAVETSSSPSPTRSILT